ncbi:MAG: crossover junction endodeoxyribonuclease RuvC [Ectothiorhodospiraceae bacterium]|nr:crossover junction endodeoxyribonuclease RuvC [Ectothiorhodospiraceae bacterium]MCH8505678.1 crossover junction endodeoxyribonuclease RuvC [Ectothiorhodospiraceae bacterium]
MTRILGIDPGSRITGYGLVDGNGQHCHYVASGVIRTADAPFPDRLRIIFQDLSSLIKEYQPHAMAIENVHVRHNVSSALKLGQARGAAICAGANEGLPVHEYTPAVVKQALVGVGNAGKAQVQAMVQLLLELPAAPPEDAADALAMAICHLNQARLSGRTALAAARQWK